MRTIAFDIGTRRVGVAISDPSGMLATSLFVYQRTDDDTKDARELAAVAREQQAERILVGCPVSLRGKQELAVQQMSGFVNLIREHSDLEVVSRDERMTTVIAQRAMRAADASAGVRKDRVDQVAAAVLLQGYLDAPQSRTPPSEDT
jgi:putative holliday junction resolvase